MKHSNNNNSETKKQDQNNNHNAATAMQLLDLGAETVASHLDAPQSQQPQHQQQKRVDKQINSTRAELSHVVSPNAKLITHKNKQLSKKNDAAVAAASASASDDDDDEDNFEDAVYELANSQHLAEADAEEAAGKQQQAPTDTGKPASREFDEASRRIFFEPNDVRAASLGVRLEETRRVFELALNNEFELAINLCAVR